MKAMQTPVVLSILLTLAAGTPLTVQAQEEAPKPTAPAPTAPAPTPPPAVTTPAPATPPAPKRPIHQTLTGRVVSIDRLHRAVTVQVNNLTYVLEITDSTRLSRNGTEQSMADFVVGEEISVNVMLREMPNGRIEVAVLSVNLPDYAAAQGTTRRSSALTQPPPFQNGPNPGNVDGPVVSRNY